MLDVAGQMMTLDLEQQGGELCFVKNKSVTNFIMTNEVENKIIFTTIINMIFIIVVVNKIIFMKTMKMMPD